MLSLGFDAKRLFYNQTGLGNYSRTLLTDLCHYFPEQDFHLYSPQIPPEDDERSIFYRPPFQPHSASSFLKSYWRSISVKDDLVAHQIDIYHGLSNELPLTIQRTKVRSIVTIHDLIFKDHPEWYALTDRNIYDYKFRKSCELADHIIAVSEYTRQDIIRWYQIPPEKISVIHPAVPISFREPSTPEQIEAVRARWELPSEFILYVGAIESRKRLLNLLKAHKALPEQFRIPLVVVGSGKNYESKVRKYIRRQQMEDLVLFRQSVGNDDLPAIYSAASLMVYPSIYEGFGLPVLEGIYRGTPVITCNTTSLTEAGGEAAFYVEPDDLDALRAGIIQLLDDPTQRTFLSTQAAFHLEKFEPERLTRQLWEVYQKVVETKG